MEVNMNKPADTEDNLKKEIISKVNEYQYSTLDYSKEKVIEITKSETLKKVFKDELRFLENLTEKGWIEKGQHIIMFQKIERRIEELTQKLKLLASPDTKPSVLHKELETKE